MEGTKALALDAFAERRGLAHAPARLFGHRLERRQVRGWHAGAVAGGSARRDGPADRGAADRRRLVDGRAGSRCIWRCSGRSASRRWSGSPPRRISPIGASRAEQASRELEPITGPMTRATSGNRASDCCCSTARSRSIARSACSTASATPRFRWRSRSGRMRALRSADVQLNVLKGGGHRLSEPHEIDAILRTVAALLEPAT